MKRKILKIALAIVLTFSTVTLSSGEMASAAAKTARKALGRGDDHAYCYIGTGSDKELKECSIVLTYYHRWDRYNTDYDFIYLSINSGADLTTSRDRIKSHLIVNDQIHRANSSFGLDTFVDKIRANMNKNASYLQSVGLDTQDNKRASCEKITSTRDKEACLANIPVAAAQYKAGLSLAPYCFTDVYESYPDCLGQESYPDPQDPTPSVDPTDSTDPSDPGGGSPLDNDVEGGDPANCSTLFPQSWCGENGITEIINFVVAVLTGTVVIAGTVGIIICAVLILTARDNEQQLATGKKRLVEVVIGMIAWLMLSVIVNLLFPKTTDKIDEQIDVGYVIEGEKKA